MDVKTEAQRLQSTGKSNNLVLERTFSNRNVLQMISNIPSENTVIYRICQPLTSWAREFGNGLTYFFRILESYTLQMLDRKRSFRYSAVP